MKNEILRAEKLSFSYGNNKTVLTDISFSIKKGEFVLLAGKSGSGKTTLLKLLKPLLSPKGIKSGQIFYENNDLYEMPENIQVKKIGFAGQNPQNNIVTDEVWHELAFGLENLGVDSNIIRSGVAEISSFFGIEEWFYKKTNELSGGQKQILSLASVMVTKPDILILDEPTSQLDPISSGEFISLLSKINKELGVTVILSEHRLEEAFGISDRVIVLEDGKIISDGTPKETGVLLKKINSDMYDALPVEVQCYTDIENKSDSPLNIREAREWFSGKKILAEIAEEKESDTPKKELAISADEVFFRYEKNEKDVLNGFSLNVPKGCFYAILGSNGSGKTTALNALCGTLKIYGGKVKVNGTVACLPQDPQIIFEYKTVYEDLKSVVPKDSDDKISEISALCKIEEILSCHPYDISGGEQQRAALAKILLQNPDIILLDEPSKALDAHFKKTLAGIISLLKKEGKTIVAVSHDIEFCAEYADRCALFFNGKIISEDEKRNFFREKSFYSTRASRMTKGICQNVISKDDVFYVLSGKKREKKEEIKSEKTKEDLKKNEKAYKTEEKVREIKKPKETKEAKKIKGTKGTKEKLMPFMCLVCVVATVFSGIYLFDNRKYYFISLAVIFEIFLFFICSFDKKSQKAKELVLISVICAIGVMGRIVFAPFSQVKPVCAIVIIAGSCFGAQGGFLTGAVTAFVSNMYFSQGPWTPWQMLAFGIIGFWAGIVLKRKKTEERLFVSIFGFLTTVLIYGGITNPSSILVYEKNPTLKMILASFIPGLPMDIVHGISTFFFLWFLYRPMRENVERIKKKYII